MLFIILAKQTVDTLQPLLDALPDGQQMFAPKEAGDVYAWAIKVRDELQKSTHSRLIFDAVGKKLVPEINTASGILNWLNDNLEDAGCAHTMAKKLVLVSKQILLKKTDD